MRVWGRSVTIMALGRSELGFESCPCWACDPRHDVRISGSSPHDWDVVLPVQRAVASVHNEVALAVFKTEVDGRAILD